MRGFCRWVGIVGLVALVAGCATVPTGDTVPSSANQPLGGPRVDDGTLETGSRAWGIDVFSGLRMLRGR